jgi:energy-converting hydrogenase Eha subunit E
VVKAGGFKLSYESFCLVSEICRFLNLIITTVSYQIIYISFNHYNNMKTLIEVFKKKPKVVIIKSSKKRQH